MAIAAARWVDTACGGLRMLVQPPGALLLRETGASCSPLLSQRLSAALLPRLAPSSAGDRPAGAPGSAAASLWRVHATVMVLLGLLLTSVIFSNMVALVEEFSRGSCRL